MRTAVSTPITHNKQGRRSASEWRALAQAFSHGGEMRAQFCERHGVALSTFAWWRSRLRHESTAVPETPPAPASALFVEIAQAEPPVATVSARWEVEPELGRGMFLRLRRGAC